MVKPGTFVWNELMTTDPEGAKAFYAEIAGWTYNDVPMPGECEGTYTMIVQDGEYRGGMFKMEGPEFDNVPPHWGTYLEVEDVDTATAKVSGLGGTVLREPADIPDIGRFSVVSDPQGAVLMLFKSAPCEK